MIRGIYGINIAVENLDEAVKKYESVFGVKAEPLKENDFAFPGLIGVRLNIHGTFLTLIASPEEDTAISNSIAKKGEGVFLVSIEVDNIEKDADELKQKGLNFVLEEPAAGDFGKVNFVHPKSMHGLQVELYQPRRED